jgi:hypothetical protein
MNRKRKAAQPSTPAEHLRNAISQLAHGGRLWRIYDRLDDFEVELLIRFLREGYITAVMRMHCHSRILEIGLKGEGT